MKLYDYSRSSAAYRTRIVLNLKGIKYQSSPINLLAKEQQQAGYLAINPQGMVPTLELDDGRRISQSTAIVEWLEAEYPQTPLMPIDNFAAAIVREACNLIACDIHPLNNLKVLRYLKNKLAVSDENRTNWYHHWIHQGFSSLEQTISQNLNPSKGTYFSGSHPNLVDAYLVPQTYHALQQKVDMSAYPLILNVYGHCNKNPAFISAHPDQQPDNPKK
ncbi:maleylacetoacetate isomerase [Dasania marina]|uniref:maleylacetoacetate isomerase n=1 Tax=Dasania marina TaxID=471499 RepID=UPI0030DAB1B9|tara:strand:+ start:2230 stop:2883 length:654 start_codon:yes stop_codon:yes gene_type:complete